MLLINTYVAGKFAAKDRLRQETERLLANGKFIIMSTWVWEPHPATTTLSEVPTDVLINHATRDRLQVTDSELFILDTLDDSFTGGRDVEFGVFLVAREQERAKHLLVRIGPTRNLFHTLVDYSYPTWDDFHAAVSSRTSGLFVCMNGLFGR